MASVARIRDILTAGEVARLCRVSPRTAARWIDDGILTGYRVPGSLDRRVALSDFEHFATANFAGAHREAILVWVRERRVEQAEGG